MTARSLAAHPMLARQLRSLGLSDTAVPDLQQWQALLERVGRSYNEADQERYTQERSMKISSRELQQLNADVAGAAGRLRIEHEKQVRTLAILNATLDAAVHGVLMVGNDRAIIRLTPRFAEIVRLPAHLVESPSGPALLAHVSSLLTDEQQLQRILVHRLEHPTDSSRVELHFKDGRLVECLGEPIIQDGVAAGRVLFLRDITAQRRSEEDLRIAKEAAEHASRAKSGFLANMSHEMRTPLNAVLGFARVLARGAYGPLNPRQAEYIGLISGAGAHLLSLINDLLDMRRIEVDGSQLECVTLDAASVVADSLALVRPLLDERGHTVEMHISPGLPGIRADRRALIQVLVNLLSNATKFTDANGRVLVRAARRDELVWFDVEDTGMGISPTDQSRLFTYFEQLGAKHAHNMQGSGIGLALTRALVEQQGGSISVSSTPGVGSTFSFSLPVAPELAAQVAA